MTKPWMLLDPSSPNMGIQPSATSSPQILTLGGGEERGPEGGHQATDREDQQAREGER